MIDLLGMKSSDKGGPNLDVEELSTNSEHNKQDTHDSRTGSEADTAAGKDSNTNSSEENCFNEMDRRHANKIINAQTFLDVLHNEAGPSPVAMQMTCKDPKEQMTHAVEEGSQKISVSGYSDDLVHCLRKGKEFVAELIKYMEDLTTVFQDHLEEVGKARETQEGVEITMEDIRGGGRGGRRGTSCSSRRRGGVRGCQRDSIHHH